MPPTFGDDTPYCPFHGYGHHAGSAECATESDAYDRHVLKRIRAEANEDFWKQRTDTIRDYVTRASEGDTYRLIDYLVFLEQWISRIAGENRG